MKKGSIGKKALAAILAASMVLSSSAFSVLAAPAIIGADEPAVAAVESYNDIIRIFYNEKEVFNGTSTINGGISVVYNGAEQEPQVTLVDKSGRELDRADYNVTYENNKNVGDNAVMHFSFNQNIAEGHPDYHLVKEFDYKFKITAIDLSNPNTGTTVKVVEPRALEYTGDELKLPITVTAKVGTTVTTLEEGKDYELSIGTDKQNYDKVNITPLEERDVTVTGFGNFSGKKDAKLEYAITAAKLTSDKVDVETRKIKYASGDTMKEATVISNISIKEKKNIHENLAKNIQNTETGLVAANGNYVFTWAAVKTGEYTSWDKAFGDSEDKTPATVALEPGTYYWKFAPADSQNAPGKSANFDRGSLEGTFEVVPGNDLQSKIDAHNTLGSAINATNLSDPDGTYTVSSHDTYTGKDQWKDVKDALNNASGKVTDDTGLTWKVADQTIEMIDAGVYEVKLDGTGTYTGEDATIKVRIKPRHINRTNATTAGTNDGNADPTKVTSNLNEDTKIEMNVSEGVTRNRDLTKPVVKIVDKNITPEYTLQEGIDYTFTYRRETTSGVTKTHVKIKGLGNYTTVSNEGTSNETDIFDVTINTKASYSKLPLDSDLITVDDITINWNEDFKANLKDADINVWDTSTTPATKLAPGSDYTITGVVFGAGVATLTITANLDPAPKYYIGTREITTKLNGTNLFADVVYFDTIDDKQIKVADETVDYDTVKADAEKKVRYVDRSGVYPDAEVEKITDETGKEYNAGTPLTAGHLYTVTARDKKGRYNGIVSTTFRVLGIDITGKVKIDSIAAQNFTGAAIEPELKVTYTGVSPSVVLKKGTDYMVTYANNINAGTAVAIVNFIGSYSGSDEKTFTINPVEGYVELSAEQKTALESGIAVGANSMDLDVIGYLTGGTQLSGKVDYTLSSNDADVLSIGADGKTMSFNKEGTAVLTITPKTENINAKEITVTVKVVKSGEEPSEEGIKTPTFTPSNKISKKAKTFTVTTCSVSGATKWRVKYSLKKSLKSSKTKTYAANKGTRLYRKAITCNKSKKTYYIRVQAYVPGKGWSSWSPQKSIKSR